MITIAACFFNFIGRDEKAKAGGFFMFDSYIEAIQDYFEYDRRNEFLRRSWIINHSPLRITKDNFFKWNSNSIVVDRIAIRAIVKAHNLDKECIQVSSRISPNQRIYDLDYIESMNFDLSIDFLNPQDPSFTIGLPKPVICCSDLEIRAHVISKLPMCDNLSASEFLSLKAKRASLTRKYTKIRQRGLATIAQELFYVGGKTFNRAVSSAQLYSRKRKLESSREWSSFNLKQRLVDAKLNTSQSRNPIDKKTAENFCIADGLNRYCRDYGWVSASCIVTAPSEYHPNPKSSKSNWNGSTPQETTRFLLKKWENIRSTLNNMQIPIAGIRSVEPHIDGCPHFNFLIYFQPEHKEKIKYIFRKVFGRSNKCCFFKENHGTEDAKKFFRYSTKHVKDGSNKVILSEKAWLSDWGIRQTQWFGIPQLSIWRSLFSSTEPPENKHIHELWLSVKNKDFKSYILLMGGLAIKNKDRPFKILPWTEMSSDTSKSNSKIAYCAEEYSIEIETLNINRQLLDMAVIESSLSLYQSSCLHSESIVLFKIPLFCSPGTNLNLIHINLNGFLKANTFDYIFTLRAKLGIANESIRINNKIIVNINIPSKRILDLRKTSLDKTNILVNIKLIFEYSKRNLDMSGSLRNTSINWDYRPP